MKDLVKLFYKRIKKERIILFISKKYTIYKNKSKIIHEDDKTHNNNFI